MKKKILAAAAAFALALNLVGCTMTTPATVGTIGDVEIPAGLYLLHQYNAYQDAAALTQDEDVLKATLTLGDGSEHNGADYVAEKTMENLERYAAVEAKFSELNGELSEDEQAYADSQTEGMWASYKDTLEANGIGKAAVQAYSENTVKDSLLVELLYSPEGTEPVADADLWSYMEENFRVGSYVVLPMVNTTDMSMLDEDGQAQMKAIADAMMAELKDGKAMLDVAKAHLPEALPLIGQEYAEENLPNFVSQLIYTPSSAESFGEAVSEGVLASKPGDVKLMQDGAMYMVYQAQDLHTVYPDLEMLRPTGLMEMKGEELDTMLAESGAAMEHALDAKAMKTYSAKNIK